MRSVNLEGPQLLNLYAYCTNDPVNHDDPTDSMGSQKHLKWLLTLTGLIGTLLICLLLHRVISKPLPTFLTTASPGKTYSVSLKGQKSKPLFHLQSVVHYTDRSTVRIPPAPLSGADFAQGR
jgi:hypothetical protein